MVQTVNHRQRADQNQHDQAHAFLAIVGAVGKRYACTGKNQQGTYPQGRRLAVFRCMKQFGALGQQFFGQKQQQGGEDKAEQWRNKQR